MTDSNNSQKEFDAFLNKIKKTYGEETLEVPSVDVITHPSLGFNILSGIQGVPLGRIMEFYGPEGGGKTTLSLLAIAAANRAGKRCFFIDIESALDKFWAEKLGVNWELTTYIRTRLKGSEEAFEIMYDLVKSNYFSLGVVDSVASMVSAVEMDQDLVANEKQVGGFRAKMMAAGLRKLVPLLTEHNVGVIFINQVIAKPGQMYGDPEETPGGKALKFYSSVRMRVNKLTGKDAVYVENGIQIGHKCNVKIKKNKLGAPDSRTVEFDLYYDTGIDQLSEIIDWLHTLKLAVKRGDYITYEENKYTLVAFAEKIMSDQAFKDMLLTKIYTNARGSVTGTVEDESIVLDENLE